MIKEEGVRVEGGVSSGVSPWLYIILVIIVGMVLWHFYPQFRFISKERKALESKIESAGAYRDVARALALSMPLLPDTIVNSIADSLLITIVTLNNDWVIFVLTEEGFECYTEEIEKLNKSIESVRMDFEVTKAMRNLQRSIRRMEKIQRWDNKSKKNEV